MEMTEEIEDLIRSLSKKELNLILNKGKVKKERSKEYRPNKSKKSNEYLTGNWCYENLGVGQYKNLSKSKNNIVMVRLLRLNKINGTDKKYKSYFSDTDQCYRIERIS